MTPGGARGGRASLLLALVLAVAPLLPTLLSGRTLYYRDVGQTHLPLRALTARMIADGQAPLWNPHRGAGQPLLANANALVLRPTTLLLLPFRPDRPYVPILLSVIALLALSAAGTWALLRDTGHSPAASLLGAGAFALSGSVQSLGQVLNHLEGVAWVPVSLWATRRAFVLGWNPWGILAGLALGMVLMAGEPTWVLMVILAVVALPGLSGSVARRVAGIAAVVLATGLLFSAAQVLPLVETASRGDRGAGLPVDEVLKWSLPPQALLQTVIPDLWGDPSRAGPAAYWGAGLFETSLPYLLSIHLGAPILVLAFSGAWSVHGWPRRAAALAVAATLLAVGRFTPLYPAIVGHLPGGAAVRYPVKWFVLTSWLVALLAAAGFDAVTRGPASAKRRALAAAGAAFAAVALAAGLAAWGGLAPFLAPYLRSILGVPRPLSDGILAAEAVPTIGRSLALEAAAALLLLVILRRGRTRGVEPALAAAGCLAILLAGAWRLNPSAPPEVVFAPSPLLERMPLAVSGQARFFAYPRPPRFAFRSPSPAEAARADLPPDSLAWGMRWDVRTLRNATAYGAGLRLAYDRLGDSRLDLLPGAAVARDLGGGIPLDEAVRLLSSASVAYVLAYEDLARPELREIASLAGESNFTVRLYENLSPLPRAYTVARALRVRSSEEAIEAVRAGSVDLTSAVLVEGDGEEWAAASGHARPPGAARIVRDDPCVLAVQVSSTDPGWLVLTDTYEPSWRAAIDGRPAPIRRANGTFRTVRIPPGDHEVVFTYRPASVVAGFAISALTLAAGAVVAAAAGRKRSPREGSTR